MESRLEFGSISLVVANLHMGRLQGISGGDLERGFTRGNNQYAVRGEARNEPNRLFEKRFSSKTKKNRKRRKD